MYSNKHVLDIAEEMKVSFECQINYYFLKGLPPERFGQERTVPEDHTIIPSRLSKKYIGVLRRMLKSEKYFIFEAVGPFHWTFIILVQAVRFRDRVYYITENPQGSSGPLRRVVLKFLMNRESLFCLAV